MLRRVVFDVQKSVEVPLILDTRFRQTNSVVTANVDFNTMLPTEILSQPTENLIQLCETDRRGKHVKDVPVQADLQANRICWILTEVDAPAKYYRLRVDATRKEGNWSRVKVEDDGERLNIYLGKDRLTAYNYSDEWKPFFYPINTPLGCVVRGRREEHPHHHGLWIAYGGERTGSTDIWSEVRGRSGKIAHKAFGKIVSGPVYAQFVEELQYTKPDGSKILDERRDVKIYNLPPEGRCIDFELKLTSPVDTGPKPLYLVCRVADSMRITELRKGFSVSNAPRSANPGRIVNSHGFSVIKDVPSPASAEWLFSELGTPMRARWVDFSGPVGSGWAGVALMDHPTSMDHPPHIITRCYGLAVMGRMYPLEVLPRSQGVLEVKYRVYVHLGDHEEAKVERRYEDFANSPTVAVGTPEHVQ